MKVLSLFDGLSGCQAAFAKLGVVPDAYYASEIDEYAMKITQKNFPNTIQLGSVLDLHKGNLPTDIDLLIGGSPCTDLSAAKNGGEGLNGSQSRLFWEYVRILNEINPRYFVLENVESMETPDYQIITNEMGVEPIMINSAIVSAQRRKRYFWTNIPGIKQPSPRPQIIRDILEPDVNRHWLDIAQDRIKRTNYGVRWNENNKMQPQGMSAQWTTEKSFSVVASGTVGKVLFAIPKDSNSQQNRAYNVNAKHATIPSSRTVTKCNLLFDDFRIGRATWTEIERLMGLPDGYSDLGEANQVEARGRALGNGFQIDVVAHILSYLSCNPQPKQRNVGRLIPTQECLF